MVEFNLDDLGLGDVKEVAKELSKNQVNVATGNNVTSNDQQLNMLQLLKITEPRATFLDILIKSLESLDNEREEINKVCVAIEEILESDGFLRNPKLRTALVELAGHLDTLISKLMEIEVLKTDGKEEKEVEEGGKGGKLLRIFRRAKDIIPKPQKAPSTIQKGRELLDKIEEIIRNIPSALMLIAIQDGEDRSREVFLREDFRTAIHTLIAEVRSYTNAIIRQERMAYLNMLRGLALGEVMRK